MFCFCFVLFCFFTSFHSTEMQVQLQGFHLTYRILSITYFRNSRLKSINKTPSVIPINRTNELARMQGLIIFPLSIFKSIFENFLPSYKIVALNKFTFGILQLTITLNPSILNHFINKQQTTKTKLFLFTHFSSGLILISHRLQFDK